MLNDFFEFSILFHFFGANEMEKRTFQMKIQGTNANSCKINEKLMSFFCFFYLSLGKGLHFLKLKIHLAFHFILWSGFTLFSFDSIKNWQNEWCNVTAHKFVVYTLTERLGEGKKSANNHYDRKKVKRKTNLKTENNRVHGGEVFYLKWHTSWTHEKITDYWA